MKMTQATIEGIFTFIKVLCSLVNNRIQGFCSEHGLINKNQISFLKNCFTSDHIFTLKTSQKYVTMGKEKLYVCFVDFEKAFDINVFFTNFIITGFDLQNKNQCAIKINDRITPFFNYAKGVRQGCPLSPFLFNIYVNDLIYTVNKNSTVDVYLNAGNNKIKAPMYADDLVLYKI